MKARSKCSATQTVYEELKRQILTFQLVPGSALDERQILRTLGFSRTPFREACMRLQEEGWLLAFSRRGFLIAPITLEDIAHIYEVRLIMESACAQIAAARAGDSAIADLNAMVEVEEGRQPGEGICADLIRMNFDFHMRLAEMTGNSRLINISRNILEHITRFDSMLTRYAPSSSWVRHRGIVEAITVRDPMRAGSRMQEHIEQARRRILTVFADQFPKLSLIPFEPKSAWRFPDASDLSRDRRGERRARPSFARSEPRVPASR